MRERVRGVAGHTDRSEAHQRGLRGIGEQQIRDPGCRGQHDECREQHRDTGEPHRGADGAALGLEIARASRARHRAREWNGEAQAGGEAEPGLAGSDLSHEPQTGGVEMAGEPFGSHHAEQRRDADRGGAEPEAKRPTLPRGEARSQHGRAVSESPPALSTPATAARASRSSSRCARKPVSGGGRAGTRVV